MVSFTCATGWKCSYGVRFSETGPGTSIWTCTEVKPSHSCTAPRVGAPGQNLLHALQFFVSLSALPVSLLVLIMLTV
jgi:hypothetical protein